MVHFNIANLYKFGTRIESQNNIVIHSLIFDCDLKRSWDSNGFSTELIFYIKKSQCETSKERSFSCFSVAVGNWMKLYYFTIW